MEQKKNNIEKQHLHVRYISDELKMKSILILKIYVNFAI